MLTSLRDLLPTLHQCYINSLSNESYEHTEPTTSISFSTFLTFILIQMQVHFSTLGQSWKPTYWPAFCLWQSRQHLYSRYVVLYSFLYFLIISRDLYIFIILYSLFLSMKLRHHDGQVMLSYKCTYANVLVLQSTHGYKCLSCCCCTR